MIQSMTGYGDAECSSGGLNYALEIRSVNNRYFKSAVKLSERVQFFEPEVDKLLRARLGRGSINYQLKIKDSDAGTANEINTDLLRSYADQLRVLVEDGVVDKIDMASLLTLPGVCSAPDLDPHQREQIAETTRRLTAEAIDKLIAMRREEGQALARDLHTHTAALRTLIDQTAELAPQVVVSYKNRLQTRVDELLADVQLNIEQDALLREVADFAERCDIAEELIRLRSHLDQFDQLCNGDDYVGRKLDFLAQEMLREANTIGSKANDAAIARNVVEMKGAIDRIKEQVQNVE